MASPSAAAAIATTLSRLITASAMAMVRTARQSVSLSRSASRRSSSPVTSFTAIQNSSSPPASLRNGTSEEPADHEGEQDAQHHRHARSQHDAGAAPARRQRAARERDHDGVVARQQQVDPDDLQDREGLGRDVLSDLGSLSPVEGRHGWRRGRPQAANAQASASATALPHVAVFGLPLEVAGAQLRLGQHRLDRRDDRRRGLALAEMLQHHRGRPDLPDRVGDALAGDVRGRAVHRLEQRREVALRVDVAGRRDADGAGAGGPEVGEDVAEQVRGDDDVEPVRDAARNAPSGCRCGTCPSATSG